jgi:hypothetical protein
LLLTAIVLDWHVISMFRAGPLWRDEINSVTIATLPTLADIWDALRYDSFPLLSSLLIRLWAHAGWGDTDLGFRVFGLLVGTAVLGALWLNAHWLTRSVPVLSLVLFASSPLLIRVGDSLRPYGLGVVFILLTLGLVWKVARAPNAWWVLAAALAAVASVQSLYNNAVLILAICLGGTAVALSRKLWKRVPAILGVGLAAAFSLSPYTSRLKAAQEWVIVVQRPMTLARFWERFDMALNSAGALGLVGDLVEVLWILLLALAVPAALWCRAQVRKDLTDEQKDLALYAAVVLVTASVGYLAFVLGASLPTQPWYFLPWMAVAAVLLDTLVVLSAPARGAQLVEIGIALLLLGWMVPDAARDLHVRQTNLDQVAGVLEKTARPADFILLPGWFHGVSFQRYYHGPTPWMTVPPLADHTIHRYDLIKQQMIASGPLDPLSAAVERTISSGNRVWIIGVPIIQADGKAPPSLPPAPAGPRGWENDAYVENWQLQVGALLRSKSRTIRQVPVPDVGPVSYLEAMSLFVAEGWQGPVRGGSEARP